MLYSGTSEVPGQHRKLTIPSNLNGVVQQFYDGDRFIGSFDGGPCNITFQNGEQFSWSSWHHKGVETRVYAEDECNIYCIYDYHYEPTDSEEDATMSFYGDDGSIRHYISTDVTIPAHAELPLDLTLPRAIICNDRVYECSLEKVRFGFIPLGCISRISESGSVVAVTKSTEVPFAKGRVFVDERFDDHSAVFLALLSMNWSSDPGGLL